MVLNSDTTGTCIATNGPYHIVYPQPIVAGTTIPDWLNPDPGLGTTGRSGNVASLRWDPGDIQSEADRKLAKKKRKAKERATTPRWRLP
jgi:hypothetical protein